MKFPIGQKCTILIFRENRFHAFPYLVCQKTTEIFSRIAPLRFVAKDFKPPSADGDLRFKSQCACLPSRRNRRGPQTTFLKEAMSTVASPLHTSCPQYPLAHLFQGEI